MIIIFQFSIQLIAHEIGHQFGMSHSYNSNIPVCNTRRYTTSVEPGSGATVMSYGFTCANNNPANGVTGDDDYSDSYDGTGKKITPGTSTVSGNVPGIFFDISNTDFSIGSTLAANTPAAKNDEIRIYSDARNIVVASSVQKILSVELFDMSGRHLYKKEKYKC
ncbi:reprolysin-like metallopeptidase [Chryseobacterium arthrosphaerae]|uniref:reprolysin-like metallopeptidase n=1 Tax=Chryseobacterium arthrosphaerae TaxID=651561 RepID=UPI003D32FC8E